MSGVSDTADEHQQAVNIPIPVFPPFKLRSSLIDKDPVIWEYLLADYITLFKKLLALALYQGRGKKTGSVQAPYVLSINTINQLHTFLQSFLHESSLESTQVFSLGAINPNIRENQHVLKLAVFSYIKTTNLVNLKITGASIWEFCKVYVTMADKYTSQKINQTLVTVPVIRKLVEGTMKSMYTSKSDDVSLIRSLQDYIGQLIASGKWKQDDSEVLYLLLGQRTKKSVTTSSGDDRNNRRKMKNVKLSSKSKNGKTTTSSEFAETFVNKHWTEILEELYVGGNGVNAKTCVQIMVLSLCSLPSSKILRLLKEKLEIDGLVRLKQSHPLISCVVLSKKFNEMNPDLKDILSPILLPQRKKKQSQSSASKVFDEAKIRSVIDMFPQLTTGQAKTLLNSDNEDVERVINYVLEMDVEDINMIEDYDEKRKETNSKLRGKKASAPKNVFDFQIDKDKVVTVQMGKKEVSDSIDEVDEELRKKNLERALAMLYDADEDEPDDTYVDNEGNIVPSLDYNDDDGDGDAAGSKSASRDKGVNTRLDKQLLDIEAKLFGIYSSSPGRLGRGDRNTPYRSELRRETGWTDEQIEGWARVLEKSPRRFRMLEERLVYVDGSLNKSGKKSSKWSAPKKESEGGSGPVEDNAGRHATDRRRGGRPVFNGAMSGDRRGGSHPVFSGAKSGDSADTPSPTASPSAKNNKNFRTYMEKKKKKSVK